MENVLELSEDGKTILGLYDKNVASIVIPSGVTSIGDWAFCNCSSLESITLPDSVTSIGGWAFKGCSSLENITLPDSVTSIGWYAFYGCSSLKSITIPSGVTSIGRGAFSGCSSLEIITLPSGVTSIGELALSGCSSLKSITLPDSVTSIGKRTFDGCSSLKSIDVSGDNAYYTSVDGILFNKDLITIVSFPQGYELKEYTIPSGVTSIGEWAFFCCSSLECITLPDSVTSIGKLAFDGCSSLKSIHLHWRDLGICEINKDSFFAVDTDTCTLYIPAGTYESYRQHPVFGKFKNIRRLNFIEKFKQLLNL